MRGSNSTLVIGKRTTTALYITKLSTTVVTIKSNPTHQSRLKSIRSLDEAIASLRAFLQPMREMATAHDIDGVFWASVAFRNREAEICGNRQVKHILDSLGLRTLQLRHLSMSLAPSERRVSDRERLVSAYEERDASLAMALTRAMVLRSLAIIEQSEDVLVKKDDSQVA
jgi:DNA-binding GntR family transcriptional regulator